MKINTILFDLDGTVLNTIDVVVQSFQYAYKTITGKEKTRDDILKFYGEPLAVTLEREVDIPVEEAIKIYREFHYKNFEECISLFEGIDLVIKQLFEKGYKLGIVTSRLRYTTMKALNKYGLEKYFKSIITADDCTLHKPYPEPITKALKELNAQPEEALMIGDSLFDIQGAKNSNVKSAVVSWTTLPKETYMNEKPDYVINKAEDILKIINHINGLNEKG